MIVDADELEVGEVAISDGLEEVGDILPIEGVIFQMNLVVSHSPSKHNGGVEGLDVMVLAQCSDVDAHGLVVGRRECEDVRVGVSHNHDVQDSGSSRLSWPKSFTDRSTLALCRSHQLAVTSRSAADLL